MRAIARASSSFSRHGKVWTTKDKECLSARKASCATAQWFSGFKSNTGRKTWMRDQPKDDRHSEVFPSNVPYVEHQGFFERGHCAQCPSWCEGFEQQRKCPKGGRERLLRGSQPPRNWSASRKNRDGGPARVAVALFAVRPQLTLLDAARFSQASRSRQNAPFKIPPHEASGNPWHMLLIKSPQNYEEQWQRRASPVPSRFHCWLSRSATLGTH